MTVGKPPSINKRPMLTASPPALRRATFFAAAMMASLLLLSVAGSEEVVVGVLDGTRKLNAGDIKAGFRAGEKNFITRCGDFDTHGDRFIVVLEMGNFSDYLVP
ncbi:uncharacterized protein Tco025E_05030, partial [Trypanosoma conorhini]